MTDPRKISIQDYTYSLPEERIARYPLAQRDASKLLLYSNGKISEDIYKNLPAHLPSHSLLVFNNTKVVEARLLFQKPTGGVIEIFCLEPGDHYADITTAMLQKGKVLWHCMVGGASKWKPGQVLEKKFNAGAIAVTLQARYIEKKAGSFIIELSWDSQTLSFAELLHHTGAVPLPPYLKRAAEASDKERYQTVYANTDGSVAAPTAGLHFTRSLLEELKARNIHTSFVTLHVGAGTFKPVKSDTMEGHDMHAEWIDVSSAFIEQLIESLDKKIIAVGTTSLRTIESLYWLGRKPGLQAGVVTVSQWEPYETTGEKISAKASLENLLTWMKKNQLSELRAKSQLLIAPGYDFKIVKGLITNFHQPQSTLLLLVAALTGKGWRNIYDYALEHEFRFLSYGDGSLLWKQEY